MNVVAQLTALLNIKQTGFELMYHKILSKNNKNKLYICLSVHEQFKYSIYTIHYCGDFVSIYFYIIFNN